MLFIIKFFSLLVPLLLAAEENKNPVLADVNLAIAFSDVKQKNPTLAQCFALAGNPGTLALRARKNIAKKNT